MNRVGDSLPPEWIERIFMKLAITYGRNFLSRWEGLDLRDVKADWAQELGGFVQNPDAIGHALNHLPAGEPPTVLQFRALCIGRPETALPQLPAPKASKSRVDAALTAMAASIKESHPKAWAWELRRRELAGEALGKVQRDFWREALKTEMESATDEAQKEAA